MIARSEINNPIVNRAGPPVRHHGSLVTSRAISRSPPIKSGARLRAVTTRMSAEIHFVDRQQPKAVTTQTSAAVAAHYEATIAAPKAQIAALKAQLAEVKAHIADVSAALNSIERRQEVAGETAVRKALAE